MIRKNWRLIGLIILLMVVLAILIPLWTVGKVMPFFHQMMGVFRVLLHWITCYL